MRKYLFLLITAFMLILLAGCKTTKTTVKEQLQTKQKQEVTTAATTESQGRSLQDLAATLQQEQRKDVVIEFEETEYYQPAASDTCKGFAATYINRDTAEDTESSKPPNAGAVKKRTKGKITIRSTTNTESTKASKQENTASMKQQVKQKETTQAQSKETATSTEKKTVRSWKDYLWVLILLALLAAGVCYILLRWRK